MFTRSAAFDTLAASATLTKYRRCLKLHIGNQYLTGMDYRAFLVFDGMGRFAMP